MMQATAKEKGTIKMPIKNYTTKVDVYTSLGEIQGALAKAGATKMMIDYDGAGNPTSITFGMQIMDTRVAYKLPVNADGVSVVLQRQKIKADKNQVQRIAWRNVRDWVLAQLALIEAGNVTADEVFLPYMADSAGNTLYQLIKSGQLALPRNGG